MSDSFFLQASGDFHTTRWSVVMRAQAAPEEERRRQFGAFYQQYWPPLYSYARRRGYAPHDAEDVTQDFFTRLMEGDWLSVADPARGRLRTLLLVMMKRFLANEWERLHAAKRGGGLSPVSLHGESAELLYLNSPGAAVLPDESLYDRNWALTLMTAALTRLETEYQQLGKPKEYELLKDCLTAERGEIDYAAIARQLHLLPVTARSVVHRFRRRFREIFREEVAATVASPAEEEDEMRALLASLGRME
jgi:RNA polymerase sigma-70 factor (ECF subfamily)